MHLLPEEFLIPLPGLLRLLNCLFPDTFLLPHRLPGLPDLTEGFHGFLHPAEGPGAIFQRMGGTRFLFLCGRKGFLMTGSKLWQRLPPFFQAAFRIFQRLCRVLPVLPEGPDFTGIPDSGGKPGCALHFFLLRLTFLQLFFRLIQLLKTDQQFFGVSQGVPGQKVAVVGLFKPAGSLLLLCRQIFPQALQSFHGRLHIGSRKAIRRENPLL